MWLQGEVVEFIDEFLEDEYPLLESPPKDWKTNNKKAPTLHSLYLFGFVQGSDWSPCSYLQIDILNIFTFPISCSKYPVEWSGHTAQWQNDLKTMMMMKIEIYFLSVLFSPLWIMYVVFHFYNEMIIKCYKNQVLHYNLSMAATTSRSFFNLYSNCLIN